MVALTQRPFEGGAGPMRAGFAAAIVGSLGCVAGAALGDARQAAFSYLTAYFFVISIQLGALIFLMIAHLAAARWALPLRRLNEAIAASLVATAPLFVPIVAFAAQLYVWVEQPLHAESVGFLPAKHSYLNVPAFALRAGFYFAVWLALALLLRRSSLASDRGVAVDARFAPRVLSAAGMPVLGLTLTFASIDWIMSLEPEWFSSMFGIYCFAGGFVASIALLTIATCLTERSGWLAGLVNPSHYHALGRMLLAFTIFWAYIAYFQFFLIYIADRPEETVYFVRRSAGSWRGVALALALGHFVLPFALLLQRGLKFRPLLLGAVAGWLLAVHYLDVYFLVMPVLHADGVRPHWLDLAALLMVGGAALGAALLLVRGHAIVPHADPEFALGVEYRSS